MVFLRKEVAVRFRSAGIAYRTRLSYFHLTQYTIQPSNGSGLAFRARIGQKGTTAVIYMYRNLLKTYKLLHRRETYTLDPRYNAVIGRRALYRVITRTTLYWIEQQKTLVSPCCHFSRLSHHYQFKHRYQRTCSHYSQFRLKATSVLFVSVRHSAHVSQHLKVLQLLYERLHCGSCRRARHAVDAIS